MYKTFKLGIPQFQHLCDCLCETLGTNAANKTHRQHISGFVCFWQSCRFYIAIYPLIYPLKRKTSVEWVIFNEEDIPTVVLGGIQVRPKSTHLSSDVSRIIPDRDCIDIKCSICNFMKQILFSSSVFIRKHFVLSYFIDVVFILFVWNYWIIKKLRLGLWNLTTIYNLSLPLVSNSANIMKSINTPRWSNANDGWMRWPWTNTVKWTISSTIMKNGNANCEMNRRLTVCSCLCQMMPKRVRCWAICRNSAIFPYLCRYFLIYVNIMQKDSHLWPYANISGHIRTKIPTHPATWYVHSYRKMVTDGHGTRQCCGVATFISGVSYDTCIRVWWIRNSM